MSRQQQQQQPAAVQHPITTGGTLNGQPTGLNADMPSVDRRAFQPPVGGVGPVNGQFGTHGASVAHLQAAAAAHQIHPAMLPHQNTNTGPQQSYPIITHLDQMVSRRKIHLELIISYFQKN